jgi:hypothetical protein
MEKFQFMVFPPCICILCTDIDCHFVLSLHLNKDFLVFCTKSPTLHSHYLSWDIALSAGSIVYPFSLRPANS